MSLALVATPHSRARFARRALVATPHLRARFARRALVATPRSLRSPRTHRNTSFTRSPRTRRSPRTHRITSSTHSLRSRTGTRPGSFRTPSGCCSPATPGPRGTSERQERARTDDRSPPQPPRYKFQSSYNDLARNMPKYWPPRVRALAYLFMHAFANMFAFGCAAFLCKSTPNPQPPSFIELSPNPPIAVRSLLLHTLWIFVLLAVASHNAASYYSFTYVCERGARHRRGWSGPRRARRERAPGPMGSRREGSERTEHKAACGRSRTARERERSEQ